VVVVTRWDQVRASPNPVGYVMRIADNLLLEHFKRNRTFIERFGRMASVDDEESAASAADSSRTAGARPAVGAGEPPDRVGVLLRPLVNRPRQAEAVEMHYAQGLTFKEIAEFLDAQERTVRNNATLGITMLRDHHGQGPASTGP
jgi:DNA-directed RNA polymerase specialized sigma24 family protein